MKEAKKNVWLMPGEICIASGNSGAKNLMFESKKDHKLFLDLWDKYLGEMTQVLNYHLSPDGWTILFKTKSEKEIISAYLNQRKKSSKAKIDCTLSESKRMISEHIRIFLSQYVRRLNTNLGRNGSLVMSRFRKYIIKKHADYQRIFKLLTQQIRFPSQRLQKYRPDENDYDLLGEMRQESIWKTGKILYEGERVGLGSDKVYLRCMKLMHPKSDILRNFFTNRKSHKNTS